MSPTNTVPVIQYFFAPQSPWAYLGHQRLQDIAAAAGARIELLPADYGRIFPQSGGLPLPKRAPQRQAYRLVELVRFSQHLGLPLNPQPTHFPVPGDDAARLIIAVQQHDGTAAAMAFTGAYWIALFELLASRGFTVLLVNARHFTAAGDAAEGTCSPCPAHAASADAKKRPVGQRHR